jgi:hypothetical protein
MAQVSNKTLMMVIFLLSVVFIFTLLYGCSCTFEKFQGEEAASPAPTSELGDGDQMMKKVGDKIVAEQKQEEETQLEKSSEIVQNIIKGTMNAAPAPAPSPAPSASPAPATTNGTSMEILNSKEKELFDQITTNKLSGEELEKLIKAGVVTEQMIEKFLSQLDTTAEEEMSSDKQVEAFCSGDCYAKF